MSITTYLPSKRLVITTLLIVAILVSGIVIFKPLFAKKSEGVLSLGEKNKNVASETIMIASLTEEDSDNDGIRDWEEALWGTSSQKEDTDEDGISDFDEISEKKLGLSDSSLSEESLNETDDFARSIFASIISLKESGSLTSENIEAIASTTTTAVSEQQQLPDTYTIDDLKLISPDASSRATYAKALYTLFTSSKYEHVGEELTLIAEYIESGSTKSNSALMQTIESYNELASAVKKLSTPSDAGLITLSLANTLTNIGLSLNNLLQFRDNSMVGIIGLSQYKIETDEFFSQNNLLRDYIVTHGLYIE